MGNIFFVHVRIAITSFLLYKVCHIKLNGSKLFFVTITCITCYVDIKVI